MNTVTDPKVGGYLATIIGTVFILSVICAEQFQNIKNTFQTIPMEQARPIMVEAFGNDGTVQPTQMPTRQHVPKGFYQGNPGANQAQGTKKYVAPNGSKPMNQQNVNLNSSGDQLLSYQLYQQAVNAATPTLDQLQSISGQSQQQTGAGAKQLGGGLSTDTAPYDILSGSGLFDSEYQAVNLNNTRAQKISACAQNAPTFVATSLLPNPSVPGQQSWDINAPNNILANQNFLSATQQVGIDTILGSARNTSYDIRNNIPNPINVVSPWMNTSITPDLEKRPLDCFVAQDGLYGCTNAGGANTNPTFVGK